MADQNLNNCSICDTYRGLYKYKCDICSDDYLYLCIDCISKIKRDNHIGECKSCIRESKLKNLLNDKWD